MGGKICPSGGYLTCSRNGIEKPKPLKQGLKPGDGTGFVWQRKGLEMMLVLERKVTDISEGKYEVPSNPPTLETVETASIYEFFAQKQQLKAKMEAVLLDKTRIGLIAKRRSNDNNRKTTIDTTVVSIS